MQNMIYNFLKEREAKQNREKSEKAWNKFLAEDEIGKKLASQKNLAA
ncbi:hypothetical protein SAMN06313486_10151 [Epsilonproteobacteria bacterium SCGC AD-308-P11]|jgi:hypothetical protein|nr:hypothetical protein SAMN06313486_10151 [Epsilonproteobacteria bacterium SCGC AD-308-P11]